MQLVLAYVCVAMAIGVFVMGNVVFWLIIRRGFVGKYLAKFDAIGLCVAMILGGGLIWLSLHYGFEFLVNQPVQDKLAVALQRVPKQSSACNTVGASYGLIIDAGSSGSRIYIYCWKPAGVNGIPWVTAAPAQAGEPPWIEEDDKPLSAVSSDMDAEKSLKRLTNYAIEKIGNDPQTLKEIPLHVMATAGMRLLEDKDQNKIIGMVEKYLTEKFARARMTVIKGRKEALYGWIAVNYLMGFLKEKDGNSSPTMGILELGGASTQIAYASSNASNAPRQNLATLQWGSTAYQIYVQSLPEWGQDEALKKIDKAYKSDCYPKEYDEDSGLEKGTGNYNQC